jgi:hypothetical protein
MATLDTLADIQLTAQLNADTKDSERDNAKNNTTPSDSKLLQVNSKPNDAEMQQAILQTVQQAGGQTKEE